MRETQRSKRRRRLATLGLVGLFASPALLSVGVAIRVIFFSKAHRSRDLSFPPLTAESTSLSKQQTPRPLAARNREMLPALNSKEDTSQTTQSPNGGAFVHLGKTGGSTLSVLLRNGCHSYMPHPCRTNIPYESIASKVIESYYHVPDFALLRQAHHDFYLVTLRDPFDRTKSAFVFEHIRNRYARNETVDSFKTEKYEAAYSCFPTLQKFVEYLGEDSKDFYYPHKQNWVDASSCPDLARAAFHGRVKIYNHLYFTFERIKSFLREPEKQTIYVTRQEHLWQDWRTANLALGQPDPVYMPLDPSRSQVRNSTVLELQHKQPVNRTLDKKGARILCNALKDEYRAYFWFLMRAKNLKRMVVQDSVQRAKRNCPTLKFDYVLKQPR